MVLQGFAVVLRGCHDVVTHADEAAEIAHHVLEEVVDVGEEELDAALIQRCVRQHPSQLYCEHGQAKVKRSTQIYRIMVAHGCNH